MVRRELSLAGAQLLSVEHGSVVTLRWSLPATEAAVLQLRLGDSGQGQLSWIEADNQAHV
jgi:hypothetical protein